MSRIYTIFTTILLASVALTAVPLFGQGLGLGANPPLSPWLNLYNRSPGPVDNYHMYVQPVQQLQNTLQAQQMGINHNAAAVNSASDQFTSQAEAYFAAATPTGNGAGFMNQGHYFNNTGMGGAGVFGMPGIGGSGRPGGVQQFGTPGLGGATPGGYGAPAVRGAATAQGMGRI